MWQFESARPWVCNMQLGILQIYPSVKCEVSTMICRVLISDTQISALQKISTQDDTLIEGQKVT